MADLPASSTYSGALSYHYPQTGLIRRSLPNMAHSILVHEPAKIYPYHLLLITNYRLPADVDRCNLEVKATSNKKNYNKNTVHSFKKSFPYSVIYLMWNSRLYFNAPGRISIGCRSGVVVRSKDEPDYFKHNKTHSTSLLFFF